MADHGWSDWPGPLAPYGVLLDLFVRGSIGADEFELLFLRLYKLDPTAWDPELFSVLDGLFADVDAYCGDEELAKMTDAINESTLRERARTCLQQLRHLAG